MVFPSSKIANSHKRGIRILETKLGDAVFVAVDKDIVKRVCVRRFCLSSGLRLEIAHGCD